MDSSVCSNISNSGRWAAAYLATYCSPGKHDFRDAGNNGLEWCTICYKEQRIDGTTCLVCDQRGEIPVVLESPTAGEVTGRLCIHCDEGLPEADPRFRLKRLGSGRRR
ncbi:MAG: hypothetical protein ACM3S1_05240 [Hyphomicrobiales bacterium]